MVGWGVMGGQKTRMGYRKKNQEVSCVILLMRKNSKDGVTIICKICTLSSKYIIIILGNREFPYIVYYRIKKSLWLNKEYIIYYSDIYI